MAHDRIAVIGMAGRFPGALDTRELWKNLEHGVVSCQRYTDDELIGHGVARRWLDDPGYVKAAYPIDRVEMFDAEFFRMPPREAAITDPQQRLFLESVWVALETAGYDPSTFPGDIGLYAGSKMNSYLLNNLRDPDPDTPPRFDSFELLLGNDKDYLTTRVSYKLNLTGPSVVIQTACSSSLVAVHQACESLISGDCDMAVAGGVSVRVPAHAGYFFQKGAILSPDGYCRAYSEDANGTVEGNGVGVVVLKRLEDAIAAGDHILAVIRGSAVNNDGGGKIGFTAPSGDGQMRVVAEAMQVAGVRPEEITLVEGHGTGTPLGDPVEVTALTNVYRKSTDRTGYCALGSVKANIGHLDTAAGIASFIKTVLALQHKTIAPAANYSRPNPKIGLDESPFYIPRSAQAWECAGPRIAGVTSLGIGGTNCHVIVEEAPPVAPPAPTNREWHVLPLSARTPAALERTAKNLAEHLEQHPDLPLADVAWTLWEGRKPFACRKAVLCRDRNEAIRDLLAAGSELAVSGQADDSAPPSFEPDIDDPSSERERLRRLAERWTHGLGISGRTLYAGEKRVRLPLPTYPFEYQRYWVEPARIAPVQAAPERPQPQVDIESEAVTAFDAASDSRPAAEEIPSNVHYDVPSWTTVPLLRIDLERRLAGRHVVVIHDESQRQHWVRRVLSAGAASVVRINRGAVFQRTGDREYAVDLANPQDYERCFEALSSAGTAPSHIVYCSTFMRGEPDPAGSRDFAELWELLALVQGIGRSHKLRELTLAIVTRDTQDVLNNEVLNPAQAILESFVKSVPLEYPQIAVKLLDTDTLAWNPGNERFLDRVLEDMTTPGSNVFAYRNGVRWKKSLQSVALPPFEEDDATEAGKDAKKDVTRGAYLVTGGLGDIALELCAWLTAHGARHLVLLAKPDTSSTFADQEDNAEELSSVLDRLSAAYVVDFMRSRGTFDVGREYDIEEIVDGLSQQRRFRRYIQFLIRLLIRTDFMRHRAGKATFTEQFVSCEPADVHRRRALDAYPRYSGMIDLLSHCVSHYAAVFSGDMDPTKVLYPDGTGALLEQAYRDTAPHGSHEQYGRLLLDYIDGYRKHAGRPIRILEIGGGNGNLTKTLLPALNGGGVHYCFTDISRSFVRDAETMAKHLGFNDVTFATLDITKDLEAQGFTANAIDLVVGLDVVHATPDIEQTLRNIWRLVKDDGAIGLVETTRDSTWLTMVMGLTDGWWAFHDDREASPLLAPAAWNSKLEQAKLGPFAIVPEPSPEPRQRAECSLIVIEKRPEPSGALQEAVRSARDDDRTHARKEGKETERREKLQRLKALGAEVVLVRADVADREEMTAALSGLGELRDRIDGVIHTAGVPDGKLIQGRTREDVEEVLAPKVFGVQNLYHALGDRPLSMWVNCSSVVGVNGGVGQFAHCAANQYLDDFTAYLRRHGQPNAVSINWEAWSEIGQAEESRTRFRAQMTDRFITGRGRKEGLLTWSELGDSRHTVYETTFNQAKDWFLSGHRIKGRSVLPGTVFVEMMRQAANALYGHKAIELSDVRFLAPLFVGQDERVRVLTILDRRDQHHDVSIVSVRGDVEQAQLHVTGKIRVSPVPATVTLDVADLERRCAGTDLIQRVEHNDARWNCLTRATLNKNMGLAELTLADEYRDETARYALHPAVLDVAIGFLPLQFRETSHYIPVHYRKITVFDALPARLFAFARIRSAASRQSDTLDIYVTLLDPSGRRLADIDNVTLRRVHAATEASPTPPLDREAPELLRFLQHVKRQTGAWLTPAEGVEAFARIVGSGLPRVVTTKGKAAAPAADAPLARRESAASPRKAASAPASVGKDLMKARPALKSEYVAASNRIERSLSEIWSNVLGVGGVGVEDNFFELGGDSMLSIQVSSLVNAQIGVEVPSALLFEYPTIRKFAEFLQARLRESEQDLTAPPASAATAS